tara:strand:- start:22 stop:747 length:726 start_codon:yes stop_codon:yes gene_type:complete
MNIIKRFIVWIFRVIIILVLLSFTFSSSLDINKSLENSITDLYEHSTPESQQKVVTFLDKVCDSPTSTIKTIDVGSQCTEYKSGSLSPKEFLGIFISDFSKNILDDSDLTNLNIILSKVSEFKIFLLIITIILLTLVSIIIHDGGQIIKFLNGLFLRLGIWVFLPYILIKIYDLTYGLDTSPVINSLFLEQPAYTAQGIISSIMVIFLRSYNTFVITMGLVFLLIGAIGITATIIKRKALE